MIDPLSARGSALVKTPTFPPYLLEHFARSDRLWALDRPDGYIPMCIAENKLVFDLLAPKVNVARTVPPDALSYQDMVGPPGFRRVLADFLGRWVLGRPVRPDHLAVLAGAGTILEALFYAIADAGDGVLVPTPSYAGFWMDLETRDELTIMPVHTRVEDGCRLTVELLDEAVAKATCPIRALLFTTPNNPVGTTYTRAELEEVLSWAESRGIHVVFDEVYALSVFGEQPFVSAATLRPSLGDHVHIVWAFSKDFAASGLRCGVLVSENAGVQAVVNNLAYWSACSGDTLHLIEQWITDEDWLERYVTGMRSRLRDAYQAVVDHLDTHRIRYVPGGAGFFVLVDLKAFLPEDGWSGEEQLWRKLLDAGINLTPGSAIRSAEPGIFRLCFASVESAALEIGLYRLAKALHV